MCCRTTGFEVGVQATDDRRQFGTINGTPDFVGLSPAPLNPVQLILSHINTDFDALGAMVGAGKLFPQARLVLAGGQDRNVREFLTLHAEFLDLVPANTIDPSAVTRVIVIETQSSRRLGEFAELVFDPRVDVVLYD